MIRRILIRTGKRVARALQLQRLPGWHRFVDQVRPMLSERNTRTAPPPPADAVTAPVQRSYAEKLAAEIETFTDIVNVANLPEIHGYWADRYVRPLLERFGFANEVEFLVK
jgi:hypothetical protein